MAKEESRDRHAKPVKPKDGRPQSLMWAGIIIMTLAVAGAVIYSYRATESQPVPQAAGENATLAAQYVGSNACVSCHDKESSEWRNSQHHDAMAQASEASVLGDLVIQSLTTRELRRLFLSVTENFWSIPMVVTAS